MDQDNFLGAKAFVWWVGEVVNIADPTGIGRCQVRIFGHHTDNESLLPKSDLPWAHPMKSINNSTANSPLEEGNWVVGFFMDGYSGQFPIMMGVLPGLKQ